MLTELFNNQNKGNIDLFCSRFSTDIDAVNYCVNTIDIHTLIKKELHKCIEIKTGSKHEELTPREIKIHVKHLKNLKQKLCGYVWH